MGRRLITNIILCAIFATTLIITCDKYRSRIVETPKYEMASTQSCVQEEIITHTGYVVSYNTEWRIPNWVAYELTADEVAGTIPRENKFQDDPSIYGEAETEDYTNSGYDRGHMAPAGDMKWSEKAMKESFYMTNICPQNHNLNGGDWKDLEEHVRMLATKYNHIYICCGPIVEPSHRTIGKYSFEQIAVPNAFFKVLLRQKDSTWTAIGFKMPNKAGHHPLATYAMSVNELEKLTDIDFFFNLPDSIEEKVESKYVLSDWNLSRPKSSASNKSTNKKNNSTQQSASANTSNPKQEAPPSAEPVKDVAPQEATTATTPSSSTKTSISSSTHHETYNGHTVYTGPRGGKYYINSKGNKVYIKKK